MRVKYEIFDQVFPGDIFNLSVNLPVIGKKSWDGRFYQIAEESCQEIVKHSPKVSPIKSAIIKYVAPQLSTELKLTELNASTGKYESVNRTVTDEEIEIAKRLFFAQSPAQAWLLLATRLVRSRDLGITLPDTEIAVLAQHHTIFQRTE